jgi:hypothetical protein
MLIILMSGFAPMVSQTLLANKLHRASQAILAAAIQAPPPCAFHDAMGAESAAGALADASATTLHPAHDARHNPQHDSQHHHDGQEACGYCNLFAHSPLLLNTLLHSATTTFAHHAFTAAIGAAFRPHTVAAASRAQPPPLI